MRWRLVVWCCCAAALAQRAGSLEEFTRPVLRGTCARDSGRFNIRQAAPRTPITNPLTMATRNLPPVSLASARVNALGPAQVSCELTGDVDAHPVAYRVSDVYDQGDGLDFTNVDLGYPIVHYTNPLTGTQIPRWGWGYGDFTVSAWFRGSYWGDVNKPTYPTVPGPCSLLGPGLVECGGFCVPIEHCAPDADVCSGLLPYGKWESCKGSCVLVGDCSMLWGPKKRTSFNQTVKVDFARGLQNPDVDYVYLFSKATAGMTLPGPTIILWEDDKIQFRMNDAEPWTLNTECDGCLSQGEWSMLTFVRESDVLKVYVDGEFWDSKEVAPFYVMNQANVRWAANHVFEAGQNMDGWLDDLRFYDFALNAEGVRELLNTTSTLDCFDVVPPLHGSWGTCAETGYLPHGTGCYLTCALGFRVHGDHPFCSYGLLLNNSIQCLPVTMGENCTDKMAENFAPEVPKHLDDGSCNFTCPTLAKFFELPKPADICRVYNPNNWFEWQGLLAVPAHQVAVLQGSSIMSQYSGRVELATGSTLLMRRTVIQHQHGSFGGAVESLNGTLIIDLCLFQYNVADDFYVLAGTGHGGSLYFHEGGRISASSSQFVHNAAKVGGSIVLSGGTVAWFHDCQFSSNTAYRAGVDAGGGAIWNRGSTLKVTDSTFNGNSAGGEVCVDDDVTITASNFGAFGVTDCVTAKEAVDLSDLTCDDNLFNCCGIYGIGDGTLRSVCPGACGDCGVGGTWVSDGFRPVFRGLTGLVDEDEVHVGGSIAATSGNLDLTGNTLSNGAADLGDELYLSDMISWVIRDTVLSPFDELDTVTTVRCPLAGCSEQPCSKGYNCEYYNYTTVCTKCTPNLFSEDGIRCQTCPSGYGPADNGTRCDRCPPRLYSNTITGVVCSPCAPGSEANVDQSGCVECSPGYHSPDGLECVACPPGLEPVASFGAASCVRCPPGSFSANGSLCVPCASGTEPLSTDMYYQKLNQSDPWSPWELPRYTNMLEDLTTSMVDADAVQLRHGDFAEPMEWCSNGLGWNQSACEEGTCLDWDDNSLLYEYLPVPPCTDDDATVQRILIAADSCLEALNILESVGYSCFTDLRPAGFDFGLQESGYRRSDHDGSLSFVCPQTCDICPYEMPVMNVTMTEEETHNLTLCIAANHSCAQQWHFPKSIFRGWPTTLCEEATFTCPTFAGCTGKVAIPPQVVTGYVVPGECIDLQLWGSQEAADAAAAEAATHNTQEACEANGFGWTSTSCIGTASDEITYPDCGQAYLSAGADDEDDCPDGCMYRENVAEIRTNNPQQAEFEVGDLATLTNTGGSVPGNSGTSCETVAAAGPYRIVAVDTTMLTVTVGPGNQLDQTPTIPSDCSVERVGTCAGDVDTLVNITGPVGSTWQDCANGETCVATDPGNAAAVAACATAILDGTPEACQGAGDCTYTPGDSVGLDGRECDFWGDRDVVGAYGMHPTSHTCSARVYQGFAQTGSVPWCYVRDSVCTKRRVSNWRSGASYLVAASGSVCLSCENLGDDMYSTGDPATPCESCEGGTQPNSMRTGCEHCPPGHISPYGSPCTPCPNGTQPDRYRIHCESCVLHTVTPTDSDLCTLNSTVDFGVTSGTCTAAPRPRPDTIAVCTYVAGSFSASAALDTIDVLDSCTSTVVETVTVEDDILCTLNPTFDFGVTPGTCEANYGVAASCTGNATRIAASCTGNATTVAAACTGTAAEVPATCAGTADDGSTICDLDVATDGFAGCAAGCTYTASYTPLCDLDAATDGYAACPAGCAHEPGFTPVCDLDNTTDSSAACPAGCVSTPTYIPACDLDAATDASAACLPGCTHVLATATCAYVPGTYADASSCTGAASDSATYPDCAAAYTSSGAHNEDDCPDGCIYSASSADGVPDLVVVPDSCTSTLVPVVTTNDTMLCNLSESTDFGATNGTCVDGGPTATCKYVRGEYSSSNKLDTIDVADSCTSTLIAGPSDTFVSTGTKCTICANGTEPDFNRSACLQCPKGWVAPVGERCAVCPDGREPDANNAYCQDCAPGYAGRDGICALCPYGKMPNGDQPNGDLPTGDSHWCVDCPPGFAAHAWRSGRCIMCSDGYHPVDNHTRCERCPFGKAGTSGFCYDCSSGTKENSNSSSCMPCPPGQAGLDGFCSTCADGYLPDPLLSTCIQCPSGQAGVDGFCERCAYGQEPRGNRTYCGNCTYDMVSTGHECQVCETGFAVGESQYQCDSCPAGQYSNEELLHGDGARERINATNCSYHPNDNWTATCEYNRTRMHQGIFCEYCAPGYQPERKFESPSCVTCREFGPAFHSSNGSDCERCPPGFEPNEARSDCVPCPPGWAGSDGKCDKCPAGSEPIAITCTGTAAEVPATCTGVASEVPASCTGNATEVPATCTGTAFLNVAICDLDPVTDGSALCANGCTATEAYTPICDLDVETDGSSSCPTGCTDIAAKTPVCDLDLATDGSDQCPDGCTFTAATTPTCDLAAGTDDTAECPPGCRLGSAREVCIPCEATYAGTDGFCDECADGKMPNPIHTACVRCALNFAGREGECEKCIDAKEPNEDHTHCQPCAANAAGVDGFCDQCPSGRAPSPQGDSTAPEQTVCESCLINAAGIDGACNTCGDGQQADELRINCIDCPPGRAGYAGICVACLGGQQPNSERTECLDCDAGMVSPTGVRCDYCDPGYETDSAQTVCLECPSGQYSNAGPPWNQPRCSMCAPGSQASSVRFASGCTDCIALGRGYASTSGEWCEVCPAGTQPNYDQTGCEFCPTGAIRAGTPSEIADVMCEVCPDGKNAWARQSCEMCGTNEQGRQGVCSTCPDGKQPSPSHTQCDNCPIGYAGVSGRCYLCEDAERPSDDLTGCEWCPMGYRGVGGECFPCLSGSQPSIDRGGTEIVLWRHGTMCQHCSPGRAGVDGICGFCDPGTMPSPDRTVCLPCLPNSYSHDGVNCTACPLNTDTRNLGTKTERDDCICSGGMYDAVQTEGTLECYNEKGQLTETVNPDVTAATDCYPCPACYDCKSDTDNTNPHPAVGFWRRSDEHKQLVKCTRDAATSPCLGGPSPGGGSTACREGYEGVICGSCKLGYEPNLGDGTCQSCPERWVSIMWSSIGFVVLFGVAGTMIRKTRKCAKPPTIDDVLRNGQNDLEVILQCARILIAFLQVQALIGSFALNWPSMMVIMFQYGSMPADPYFIAQSAYCLRTMAGEDWVYMRAMSIMSLPFVVSASIGLWYAWLHFTSLGCKADPSLTYITEVKEQLKAGTLGNLDEDGDGEVTEEEIMRKLDQDHDGTVTKDEFKEFWDQHRQDHIPKSELLTADSIILVFVIYPSIVREAFSLFSCEWRGPEMWLLTADVGVECYSTNHSLWMTFVGIPAICFFCGLLPAMAIFKLAQLKRAELLEDVEMVRKYGFLYRGYEEDYCYWEIIVTARKVLVVFIAVFFKSYGAIVQGVASLVVIQTALLLNIIYGPYDYGLQDRIETLSLATSFFTLISGIYFENNRDRMGGEDQVNVVSFVVEVSATVLNASVIVVMAAIVLKPLVHKIQQKRYCSITLLIKKLYPRAFYWQPEPPDKTKVVPVVGVDRGEHAPTDGGTKITAAERREDNKNRLQAKQHSNEEAAHVLHQMEGALKGMLKYMPELGYELEGMLRLTDRVQDMVGERTRMARDVAAAANIELEPHPLNAKAYRDIVSEEIIPTVPHGHEERIQLMFKATVENDVTVLQDLFDEDALYLDVENRGGQTAIEVARERRCHEAFDFLKRCEHGLQEKSLKKQHEEERKQRDKHSVQVDEYIVHVYTADERWAGTDANVYINLVGKRAQTGMTPLTKRWHNSFERGKIDEFTVESKLGGLGELHGVVVMTDSTGVNPNWLLEKVVVTPPQLPSGKRPLPVAFRADRWLGKSKGEGETERERCTAELFPAAGAAAASLASAEAEDEEPEPVPEFHIDPDHKKTLQRHENLRAQLALSSRAEDAMELALRDEEQAEREAQVMADALEEELSNHSAPTTPPTEGETGQITGALPGQVGFQEQGAGQVEEFQSDEEEFAAPRRPGALLELEDGTVVLGANNH